MVAAKKVLRIPENAFHYEPTRKKSTTRPGRTGGMGYTASGCPPMSLSIIASGNNGYYFLNGNTTILPCQTLTINNAALDLNNYQLNNQGTIKITGNSSQILVNTGTLNNAFFSNIIIGSGTILGTNYGTIDNFGTITNSGGTLNVSGSGILNNANTILNQTQGQVNFFPNTSTIAVNNSGTINNDAGGNLYIGYLFTNVYEGTIVNAGTFNINGTFTNNGIITNLATITNGDSVVGSTNILNNQNGGQINNMTGSTFTNNLSGIINNNYPEAEGSISNLTGSNFNQNGTFNGDPPLNYIPTRYPIS